MPIPARRPPDLSVRGASARRSPWPVGPLSFKGFALGHVGYDPKGERVTSINGRLKNGHWVKAEIRVVSRTPQGEPKTLEVIASRALLGTGARRMTRAEVLDLVDRFWVLHNEECKRTQPPCGECEMTGYAMLAVLFYSVYQLMVE
jgi:hypothetical protein